MRKLGLILALIALLPRAGHCGVVEIRPTTLVISPAQHAALLALRNSEDHDTVYQLNLYRWQQNGTAQTLDPAPELIASPAIVSLPAHGSQNVRIGLRGALPDRETTYRVVLEEVPSSNLPKRQGLNIALRVSLPLFVRPSDDVPPPILTAMAVTDGAHSGIAIANAGETTVRVTRVAVATDEARDAKGLAYIMPGRSARFALPGVTPDSVKVQTDQGDIDLPVTSPVENHASAAP